MRWLLFPSLLFFLGCDYGSFDKDKRQIMAKDYVHWHLPQHSTDFDIISFKEDTINNMLDSNFKRPIAYTLNYRFTDSLKHVRQKNSNCFIYTRRPFYNYYH